MSFFFYSKDGTMNVVVDLDVLELAIGTAATAHYSPIQTAGKWDMVLLFTVRAVQSRGKITIIIQDQEGDGDHWRHPLKDTPISYRVRITKVLGAFAEKFGMKPSDLDIEVLRH